MCFLKFIPQTPVDFLPYHQKPAEQKPSPNTTQLAMFGFLKQLALNTQALAALEDKLTRSDALLAQTNSLITDVPSPLPSVQHFHEGESTTEEGQLSADPLTARLFGQNSYKYRLVLANAVPETLYKDRNFGLTFKLINLATGATESNGNLVNICLGVCDSNGCWAQESKEGTPLLKGKLEAELYHGQGEFVKLSPRDVSRSFPGKKVTLVVYAKPSVLQYSGESSLERKIDHSLIEPLLVKDISIKAKRRE